MENVEDMLKALKEIVETRVKMAELAEIMERKTPLEVARAWYSTQKGNYMITKQSYEDDEEVDEVKLKLVGFVEDGDNYKFEFETVLGDTIQLGGNLHSDYVLVAEAVEVSALDQMNAIIAILEPDNQVVEIEKSTIGHLLN